MLKCTDVYKTVESTSTIVGLTKELRFASDQLNNLDWVSGDFDYLHQKIAHEFSEKNKEVLLQSMQDLQKEKLELVVEIGIARSNEWSSTYFLLNHKADSLSYLGIDMNPACKNFVDGWNKPNTHARVIDSSDTATIMQEVKNLGFEEIDLLIIDGNHSANHIYKDFVLTEFVRKGGIILFHDTNYHPGPKMIFECIDSNVFEAKLHLIDEEDWGVGTLKKLI
jgi:hypothetical protein